MEETLEYLTSNQIYSESPEGLSGSEFSRSTHWVFVSLIMRCGNLHLKKMSYLSFDILLFYRSLTTACC